MQDKKISEQELKKMEDEFNSFYCTSEDDEILDLDFFEDI